jgi:hypothetical protein
MYLSGGFDYCLIPCQTFWLSILSPSGEPLPVAPNNKMIDCTTCQPATCDECVPQHLNPSGENFTWRGTLWETSTCGSGVSCKAPRCAAPGKYVARMCAYRSTSDAGPTCVPASSIPDCVDVDFDFPNRGVVGGFLP